jgi:hypothetical protein
MARRARPGGPLETSGTRSNPSHHRRRDTRPYSRPDAAGEDGARPGDPDPDHHLWRNGRLWWVAFTVIHDEWRQERVRVSLRTDDAVVARRRRDSLFRAAERAGKCEIRLRFARRGRCSGESHFGGRVDGSASARTVTSHT